MIGDDDPAAPASPGAARQPAEDDELIVLLTATSSFEANLIATALSDEGIEATALTTLEDTYSALSLTATRPGVPILVRAADRERAQAHLERIRRDATDIDWDEVRVEGEEEAESGGEGVLGSGSAKLVFVVLVAAALLAAIWQIATRLL